MRNVRAQSLVSALLLIMFASLSTEDASVLVKNNDIPIAKKSHDWVTPTADVKNPGALLSFGVFYITK